MQVEIFTSPQCSYCEQAKRLIADKGVAFDCLDIQADRTNYTELQRRLPRVRSLPQIFVDGAHIGGFEDLDILNRNGQLDKMIATASG